MSMTFKPDPKPDKRVRDSTLLKQMHLEGRSCLIGYGCHGPLEFDHIVKRSQGGDDTRENLRPLCQHHHWMRHNRPNTFERLLAAVSS